MRYKNLNEDPNSEEKSQEFLQALASRLRVVEKRFKNRSKAAEKAGISKSTLQNWVEGKRDPSFRALSALAEAANVSLDWLATGYGPMERGEERNAPIETEEPFNPYILKSAFVGSMISWEKNGIKLPLQTAADHIVELYETLQKTLPPKK